MKKLLASMSSYMDQPGPHGAQQYGSAWSPGSRPDGPAAGKEPVCGCRTR
jgi:hypothetical protein